MKVRKYLVVVRLFGGGTGYHPQLAYDAADAAHQVKVTLNDPRDRIESVKPDPDEKE